MPVSRVVALAPADASLHARDAGLRYTSDATHPGYRRVRAGRGFRYADEAGRTVRDPETLARIRALALPPAWTDVWICRDPRGHLQAVGRDARGRKQYRYHEEWRAARDATKYERVLALGRRLPRIRARVRRDLRRPGLPREKVLAIVVRLLDRTALRVGNEEYVRQNGSFGLTTLRNHHVAVEGRTLRFRFRGKSGKERALALDDPRLARLVRRLQDLPGQELFQYVDAASGAVASVDSADVNAYLRDASGLDLTAKDLRTWAGTVFAARELVALERAGTRRSARSVALAIRRVAQRLGNTPAVCRRAYVHPRVVDAYLDGSLGERARALGVATGRALRRSAGERVVLSILGGGRG